MGSSSYSSSPVGSSNISGFSHKGSSNSQPLEKREGWLFEAVGVFGKNFPKLSLFLQGMKKMFLFCSEFFQTLKVIAELKFQTELKLTD